MCLPAVPWLWRWGAIAALAAAAGFWCYTRGVVHTEARYEALRAQEQALALSAVQRLAKVASEIDVHWVRSTNTIHERARVITREVPRYVTAKANAHCTVTAGFVRLWDDPAGVQAGLYRPASGDIDAPAGVALSDVARGVIEARRRFDINASTLTACQAWVRHSRGNHAADTTDSR
jgi:hypothetical protein